MSKPAPKPIARVSPPGARSTRPGAPPRQQAAASLLAEAAQEKGSMGTRALSILIHGIIIAGAIILVVREILIKPPEPAFEAPEKRVILPAQLREQAISNARHDAAAGLVHQRKLGVAAEQ